MDGVTLVYKIRQVIWQKGLKQPLIYAIVEQEDPEFSKQCLKRGFNKVLVKPIDPN